MIRQFISRNSLAETIRKSKFENRQDSTQSRPSRPTRPIMWYPHCGDDLEFLSNILINNDIINSPNLFILNDGDQIVNRIEEGIHLKGYEINESMNLDFREDDFQGVFYEIELNRKKIHLIVLENCRSENLLKYFMDSKLTIDYVFTCRMAGGCELVNGENRGGITSDIVRRSLNYKYIISDFHCLTEDYPRNEPSIRELNNYILDMDYRAIEFVYYNSFLMSIVAPNIS